MALTAKLINTISWWVLNKDSEIGAWNYVILNSWIIDDPNTDNFEVTSWNIASWRCFIDVKRTNSIPEERFLVYVTNEQDESTVLWSSKKIYIEIPQTNINTASLNTNPLWTWIASIEVEDTRPSDNFIKLAETDALWNITDLREFITIKNDLITSISWWEAWKVYYSNASWILQ
jgi:hypothetical protein